MKTVYGVLATTLLTAACSSAPPAPAALAQTPAPMAYGTLAQVMQAIPFPASNIVFDVQLNDPGAPAKVDPKKDGSGAGAAATDQYGSLYGGWVAVENAAIALQETANLITLPRMCSNGKPVPVDQADYQGWVKGLADAGKAALDAAKAKDMEKFLDVAGTVSDACSACHEVYREKEDEKDRCTKPAAPAAK